MLVGSGLWLIGSYYNIVPFTGRLIFGLGQDSIAEVFETIFLFAYMGLISNIAIWIDKLHLDCSCYRFFIAWIFS